MEVFARVCASTRFMITAHASECVPSEDGRLPGTTTDPLDADTDGGGAADGAEDLDHDGAVDPGETNPLVAGDDAPLGEVMNLTVSDSGADLLLSWDGVAAMHPCALYRVMVANTARPTLLADFSVLAVVSTPGYTHAGAATDGLVHSYLVVAFDPLEGPLGHYGQ